MCGEGHRYPFVEGIPILLRDDVSHTHWAADLAIQAGRIGVPFDDGVTTVAIKLP